MRKPHKITTVLIALTLSVAMLGGVPGKAKALQFSYSTGFGIQNLEGSDASIVITFYNQDGSTPANSQINDTVLANSSKTYATLTTVASGFNGSVVISSDRQVASVVNIKGTGTTTAWAAYNGSAQGNPTVYLPLLMKNNFGFNSWFSVQNAGSQSTTATVNYSDGTSAQQTIAPNASKTFDQATETHTPKTFSGVVTSSNSQPLVAAVIQEDPRTLFAYTGFNGGTTTPVFPLVNANNFGYATGIQIQNLGGTDTTVTVSYTPASAGSACTETQTILANSSATFGLYAFSYTPPGGLLNYSTTCTRGALPSTSPFIGSARVISNSASMPLAGAGNQLKAGVNGGAYDSFDPATATQSVVFPLIMDRNFGYFTGFSVVNVGSGSTRVVCTFTNTSYKVDQTLAAGASLVDVQLNKIANLYVGAATCTGTTDGTTPDTNAKLVGVANELNSGLAGDNFLVYEGVNR